MISPLNAKLDRKWIEASQRIEKLEQQRDELWSQTVTLSEILVETAKELGCVADNEVILVAISELKQQRDELLAALKLLLAGQYDYIKNAGIESEFPGCMGNMVCGVSYSAMDVARAAVAKVKP